jgi:hypothetical protein
MVRRPELGGQLLAAPALATWLCHQPEPTPLTSGQYPECGKKQ